MYAVELVKKKNQEYIMRSVTELDFKYPWKSVYGYYRNLLFKEDYIVLFKKDDILIRSIELRKDDYNVHCC